MPKIRVLVVDDSALMRRLLREAVESDPSLEVVAVAANGRIALSYVEQVKPDVMTLDLEMPEMDGLETLRRLQQIQPKLPVVVFSSLSEHGASATLEALALGATDYVTKPSGTDGLESTMERIRRDLLPRLKVLGSGARPRAVIRQFAPRSAPRRDVPVEIVVIGTSTGGPNALGEVLPGIPAKFSVPLLIVQHMPPIFTGFLAQRLSSRTSFPVREAVDDQRIHPAEAWIARGDFHMVVRKDGLHTRLLLNHSEPENFCRPSVDVLFRSVAESYGPSVLAVVMTGMGQDGLLGAEQIRKAGGAVVVQDQPSSVVWGMPGAIVQAGLADEILPLSQIGPAIVRRVQSRSCNAAVAQQGSV